MGHGQKNGHKVSDRNRSGPEAERLKLDHEDWEDAVGDALSKPPPPRPPRQSEDDPDEENRDQ